MNVIAVKPYAAYDIIDNRLVPSDSTGMEIYYQAVCYRRRFLIHLGTDKVCMSCEHEQGIVYIYKGKNNSREQV